MNNPIISIIIPVFNAQRYIDAAIDSIRNQEYAPLEIIVIDDGSTDKSAEAAQKHSDITVYKYQDNKGAAAARNLGIRKASGTLLAFLDADDLWTANKLSLQYKTLRNHPELDMVLGATEQFISPELETEPGSRKLREELKQMPGFLMGSMLIKTDSFLRVGFLNEKLQLGEFIDWFERARHKGLQYKMLSDVVLRRRIHTSNLGITKRNHRKDYLTVLKAALDRKRMTTTRQES